MKHNSMEVYHVTDSHNRPFTFAANPLTYSGQPQYMVGRMQDRPFSQTRQARPAYHRLASRGHRRASGTDYRQSGCGKMSAVCFSSFSVAASPPTFGNFSVSIGQAHDALTSPRRHTLHADHVSSRIPLLYAAHIFPVRHGYGLAPFMMSPRRRHDAYPAHARCYPAWLPIPLFHRHHAYPPGSRYELVPFPIPFRHRHHANSRRARYRPVTRRMQTRAAPDTDAVHICFRPDVYPFVRHHPGGPAYVTYRRCASSVTAGAWLRPFEPRKGKRWERR